VKPWIFPVIVIAATVAFLSLVIWTATHRENRDLACKSAGYTGYKGNGYCFTETLHQLPEGK
jgi:hypothetical protein